MSRLDRLEAWCVSHPVPRWLDLLSAFVSGGLMTYGAMSLFGDLL